MLCIIVLEMCQDRLAAVLYLTVGLGVICSCGQMISGQTDRDCQEELGFEIWGVIGQQIGRRLVQDAANYPQT